MLRSRISCSPSLGSNPLFWLGAGLFLVGIAFKLSLVPFHAWAPDVYEGAPLPITAFMSVVTKAGRSPFLRASSMRRCRPAIAERLLLPVWMIAAISMIAGNVGMLAQHDLKRLIAYSGIAQVGYILTALAGGTALGLRYAIFYLAAYAFMNLGAFAVAALLSDDGEAGFALANYRGLAHRRPVAAALMTFFLLAMAGLAADGGLSRKDSDPFDQRERRLRVARRLVDRRHRDLALCVREGHLRDVCARCARPRARCASVRAACLDQRRRLLHDSCWSMTFYPLTPSNVLPLVR